MCGAAHVLQNISSQPAASACAGVTPFNAADVATGTKPGVCTSPCGVCRTPTRARDLELRWRISCSNEAEEAPARAARAIAVGSGDCRRRVDGVL